MEKKLYHPIAGINTDDSLENIQDGESRRMVNCLAHTSPGVGSRIVRLPNSTERLNAALPAGVNKIIGWCEWVGREKLVLFVKGESIQAIYTYDRSTFVYQLVAQGVFLRLVEQTEEIGPLEAFVKNDELLYWNQGFFDTYGVAPDGFQRYSPPRKINLNKAIGGGYSVIDWQTTMAAKFPFCFSPLCTYGSDSTAAVNRVKFGLYQFRVQYVYDDDETSRWSPISKVPRSAIGETMQGFNPTDETVNNYISVSATSGHNTVRQIRFAAREGGFGPWFIFKEIDKTESGIGDNAVITVRFYNNEEKKFTEIKDQNYDLIPQYCVSQEGLHNNTIAYGGVYEGFDKITINASAGYNVVKIPAGEGEFIHQLEYEVAAPSATVRRIRLLANIEGTAHAIPANSTFVLSTELDLPESDPDQLRVSTFRTSVDYIGPSASEDFMVAWAAFLNTLGHGLDYSAVEILGEWFLEIDVASLSTTYNRVVLGIYQNNPRYVSLKKGVTHVFGIQYYDEVNRDGTVYTNDDFRVYVNRLSEGEADISDGVEYIVRPTITLSHLPPIWARYYQFVYLGNRDIESFQQRTVSLAEYDAAANSRVKLHLERRYVEVYPGAGYWHEIQVGDIVRLLRRQASEDRDTPLYVKEEVDLVVMEHDPTGGDGGGEAIWVQLFDYDSICGGDKAFEIEIFRIKQEDEELVWREIGEVQGVVDPHNNSRRHVDQAIGGGEVTYDLDFGDVYIRLRRMGTGYTGVGSVLLNWYVEDFHWSDYRESNVHDYGRLAIFDIEAKKRFFRTKIVASEKFIEGGNMNGLSRFNSASQVILSNDYGQIRKLVEVGFVLKVLCDRMNFSIYVERQETFGADGNTSLQFVRETLGQSRPHQEMWGCVNGRLAVRVERQLFYWDQDNNIVVQDSANGQVDITTDRKVKRLFQEFRDVTNVDADEVFSGSDPVLGLVYFGFKSDAGQVVFAFNYGKGRWEFIADFFFGQCVNLGDTTYFASEGNLHEIGSAHEGLVFGVERLPEVQFVVKVSPMAIIILRSIEVYTAKNPGSCDFVAFASASYVEMIAKVYNSWWEKYESRYASFIGGDINDPQGVGVSEQAKSLDSREIRGEAVLAKHADWESDLRGYILHYKNSDL